MAGQPRAFCVFLVPIPFQLLPGNILFEGRSAEGIPVRNICLGKPPGHIFIPHIISSTLS